MWSSNANSEATTAELWYRLGRLASEAGGQGFRSFTAGFATACISGALVLLSGYFFGTAWAGPWAGAIPVTAGIAAGVGLFTMERTRTLRRLNELRMALSAAGADASRPTLNGLGTYYDVHLILLRSEYELAQIKGASRMACVFEETYGFTPEDPFETGPLNVLPDSPGMQRLRERWDNNLTTRHKVGLKPPVFSLQLNLKYQLYPREMTVPVELAMRKAYLEISIHLLTRRYGKRPEEWEKYLPEEPLHRARRDFRELATLSGKRDR